MFINYSTAEQGTNHWLPCFSATPVHRGLHPTSFSGRAVAPRATIA